MKLNNKGFAISGVLYSLLILFITLFIGILTILATTKFSLDKVKNDITDKLETLTYRDTILNGADPVLKEGMIPVTIDADGTVKKADMTSAWYDYDNKMWANAVLVTNATRSNYKTIESGTTIPETDILAYFVWIPRYKYRLWYVEAIDDVNGYTDQTKVHSIDIVFESKSFAKSNGTQNGEYLTHPAFTLGYEELNGIWVGKFETGYNGATTASEAEVSTADSSKVIIKPNTYSWRDTNTSNSFYTALNMNEDEITFGLNSDSDTHIIKNTEWGAVTYLAFSDYGKDSEVYINNYSEYLTGCGGETPDASSSPICLNGYGTKSNNEYNQSTTGNITGIFDMSGGAYEYVMGRSATVVSKYDSSGFTDETFPEDKYINIYKSASVLGYSNRILGDATGEMGPFSRGGSWYDDSARFVNESNPWFSRGGDYDANSDAGLAYFWCGKGGGTNPSFRIVIS